MAAVQAATSFRGGRTCLRNGFSECGYFKPLEYD
jgi:hypothetical protein